MSQRLDALIAREYTDRDGNKKTQWTKIGSAWPTQSGGYSVTLEALPLPTMGERGLETRIVLMVPKPRDEQQPARQASQPSYADASGAFNRGADPEDQIPF